MIRSLGPVRATTPGDPAYGRVLRLLASNVAASSNLEFDRVEDVALATNEAFGQLLRIPGSATITCIASCTDHSVDVTLSTEPGDTDRLPDNWPDTLAGRVLTGVTDFVEYTPERSVIRFRVGAPEGG